MAMAVIVSVTVGSIRLAAVAVIGSTSDSDSGGDRDNGHDSGRDSDKVVAVLAVMMS